MFSITATSVCIFKKVSTNSHASQTMVSLLPSLPLPPSSGSFPPITALISISAASITAVIIEETVVLPCVPETFIALLNLWVMSPSISLLSIVGIPCSLAATISGLSCIIAAE